MTVGIMEMYLYIFNEFTPLANKKASIIPLMPRTDSKIV
jgi:hypothetical protein